MTDQDDSSTEKPQSSPRSVSSDQDKPCDSKTSTWLAHCQQLAVNQVDTFFNEFIEAAYTDFNENIDRATTNQRGLEAMDNLRELRKQSDRLKLNFSDHINQGFDLFQHKALDTHLRETRDNDSNWSLIDKDELEETIAIKTIAHESNLEFQEELWHLEKRLCKVNDGERINQHNNPISPIQFCVALRSSLELTTLNIESKLTAYKAFSGLIYKYLGSLYTDTNDYLIAEGILPNLRFDQEITKSTYDVKKNIGQNDLNRSDEVTDKDNTTGKDHLMKDGDQTQLIYAIRSLLQKTRHYKGQDSQNKLNVPSHKHHSSDQGDTNQQIIDTVENIQSNKSIVVRENQKLDPNIITETSKEVTEELARRSPEAQVDPQDMYTIDLVGILFEYILTDASLPNSVKALLSHLHTPFLKLAFIDTQFFERPEHPARLLLDSLAEAGTNWVNNDGTAQYDMYNEIKAVVARIMGEFKNDVRLFAEILFEFNRLKNKLNHKHQLKGRNSIERFQGQEQLRLAKTRAKKELESRVKGVKLPSAVIQILKPWFNYLTLLQLRYDDNDVSWKQALEVVDELIYFFNPQKNDFGRSDLEARFNDTVSEIKTGLDTMGYDQPKAKKIVMDITALKTAIIKRDPRPVSVKEPATAEIKPPVATTPLIKEPEPVEPEETQPTEEEERVINYLKLTEAGTWIEFEDDLRLKVNGFDSKLMKYILIDSTSRKVVMVSPLELAQKIISKEAKIVAGSTKPLFERALERIFKHLDKEAKSLS